MPGAFQDEAATTKPASLEDIKASTAPSTLTEDKAVASGGATLDDGATTASVSSGIVGKPQSADPVFQPEIQDHHINETPIPEESTPIGTAITSGSGGSSVDPAATGLESKSATSAGPQEYTIGQTRLTGTDSSAPTDAPTGLSPK